MANLLDRYNKTVVGSNEKDADYQSKIVTSGDFKRVENIEAILSSWSNILITPKRTYQYDPEFGSDLYKLVFEPADDSTEEEIKEEVIEALRTYDSRATIQNVNVSFLVGRKGFNISVEVDYEGEETELQVVIDESVYFKFFEVPQFGAIT
ncbi:MAG: GPW/gp25 family protein [Candidatus Heimdallarchaeaceae archaeon]